MFFHWITKISTTFTCVQFCAHREKLECGATSSSQILRKSWFAKIDHLAVTEIELCSHHYCPQTKFSQVFVCPRGMSQSMSQGGLHPGGSLSRGVSVQGVCLREGGSLSRGSLSKGVSVLGVSVQRVYVSGEGVSVQGVSVQGVSVQEGLCLWETPGPLDRDPHTVMSRRYTSYWNAFLLRKSFDNFYQICKKKLTSYLDSNYSSQFQVVLKLLILINLRWKVNSYHHDRFLSDIKCSTAR